MKVRPAFTSTSKNSIASVSTILCTRAKNRVRQTQRNAALLQFHSRGIPNRQLPDPESRALKMCNTICTARSQFCEENEEASTFFCLPLRECRGGYWWESHAHSNPMSLPWYCYSYLSRNWAFSPPPSCRNHEPGPVLHDHRNL
jgi:hypothetical protein